MLCTMSGVVISALLIIVLRYALLSNSSAIFLLSIFFGRKQNEKRLIKFSIQRVRPVDPNLLTKYWRRLSVTN
jgi:hypothetical protein